MDFWRERVLPRVTHFALGKEALVRWRRRAVAGARGRVLEIGIGSGLNLDVYGPEVESVVGIDPSPGMLRLAGPRVAAAPFPVELVRGTAERLPLADASIDTAVSTWTLCSIPDPVAALREARRVLRPGGRLLFVEHGLAPDPEVASWQRRLTRPWSLLTGGCHLDRPIDALLAEGGFDPEEIAREYARGPRFLSFFYTGRARPA